MLALLLLCCAGINMAMGMDVVFSVGLTAESELTGTNQTVIFDKVFTNVGNGYNPADGHFTAPLAGVYAFYFSALASKADEVWLTLEKNEQIIIDIYARDPQDYSSASNFVILQLQENDKISVDTRRRSSVYNKPTEVYTTFSGYRLDDSNIPS